MNIQIFGIKKCFDTKKAERYFKERGVKFQFIDLNEKPLSKGEFQSIKNSVGLEAMVNKESKEYTKLNLDKIRTSEMREEIALKNSKILKTPLVRNGKKATIGYMPEIWKSWEEE